MIFMHGVVVYMINDLDVFYSGLLDLYVNPVF